MSGSNRGFVDEVLAALGTRYKLGAPAAGGFELLYRSGKSEFRPSRFVLGVGPGGRGAELAVDVRIPRDARPEAADPLVEAFERASARPRGFTRTTESMAEMQSEGGAKSGSVRTVRYRHDGAAAPELARQIRAIVETVDIPIVVGIHDPEHVVARDPPPPREKRKTPIDPLEPWSYDLDRGLLEALTFVIDPNDRTLRVFRRKLLTKTQIGDVVKLAHVAKLIVRAVDGSVEVSAMKRDGQSLALARGSGSPEFRATLGRMAKKVMIPLEEG